MNAWIPYASGDANARLHIYKTTGFNVAIGKGKSGKSFASLWDKINPENLAVYQAKYKRWDVCRQNCGQRSTDKFLQVLWQIYGDDSFFRWHTAMNEVNADGNFQLNEAKRAYMTDIVGDKLDGPRKIEFDDPHKDFMNWINPR